MQRIWLGFFIFLFCSISEAHHAQEGEVLATVGPYVYRTQPTFSQDNANDPVLFGLGFLAEADIDHNGGIEVGLLYFDKSYQRVFGNTHIVEMVQKLDVPVGYRYWIDDNFGVALSLSTLFSIGPSSVIYSDIVSATDSTSARLEAEYGVEASVHYEFLTISQFTFLFDARYFISISSKTNEDANQYGVMLGTKYLVHEK